MQVNVSDGTLDDAISRDNTTAAPGGEAVVAALQAENALLRSEITALMAHLPSWSAGLV